MLPLVAEMEAARNFDGVALRPNDFWYAFPIGSMTMRPTVQQLHIGIRHHSEDHLWGSVKYFNDDKDDEPFDMTDRNGMRILGREITRIHMEMPDGVKSNNARTVEFKPSGGNTTRATPVTPSYPLLAVSRLPTEPNAI